MSRRSPVALVARALVLLALALVAGQALATPAGAAVDPYAQRLSVAVNHACAIAQQDDHAYCWGVEARGQTDVPADLGPVKAIAAGYDFNCALKENGRAVCWGSGFGARWDAPSSYPDFTQIIATATMACGLSEAGMRTCWSPPGDPSGPVGIQIPDGELGPFVQLSGTGASLCGVRVDRSAWCYERMIAAERTIPADLGPIDSIAVGLFQVCAVKLDGTTRCWGRNLLGIPPLPASAGTVKQLVVGTFSACAVTTDGTPLCWANPTYASQTPGDPPSSVGRVRSLATDGSSACAIQAAGTVACWSPDVPEILTPPAALGRVASPMDLPPACTDANVDVPFNTAVPVAFSCTGRDLTYAITTPANHGSAATPAAGGTQYAPNGGFQGTDEFQVTATDSANRAATFTVHVTVAGPRDLTPDPNDQLTGQDADTFWDLDAGETDTFTLQCEPGKIAVDGHPLIQAVDQGTGQPADVQVLESRRIDRRTYEFRLSNPASGRAQGHLAVACISERTFEGHELEFRDGPSDRAWIGGFGDSEFEGEWSPWATVTLTCGDGWTAVAPGYRVNAGDATLTESQPSADGSAWTFTFFSWGTANVDTWISCLSYADAAHQVLLRSYRATTSGAVAGGDLVKRDTPLDCSVGFVGLVGGFSTSPDLRVLGQETQAKRRLYWLQNTGGGDRSATFSLLCLGLVTDTTSSPIQAPGLPVPTPTPSPNPSPVPTPLANAMLRASAPTAGRLVARALTARASGRIAAVVQCPRAAACAGTVTISSGGAVIGTGSYQAAAGARTRVTVRLTKAGRRKLARSGGRLAAKLRTAPGGTPLAVTIRS